MLIKNSLEAKIFFALTVLLLSIGYLLYLIEKDTDELLKEVAGVERVSKINVKVLELNKTLESMQRNVTAYGVSGSEAILSKLINNNKRIYDGLLKLQQDVEDLKMRQMIDALLALNLNYQSNLVVLPKRYQIKSDFSDQILPSLYQTLDETLSEAITEQVTEFDKSILLQANALWAKTNHAASLFLTQKKYRQRQIVRDLTKEIQNISAGLSDDFLRQYPHFLNKIDTGVREYLDNFDRATQANRNYLALVNVVMGGDAVEFTMLVNSLTAYTSEKYTSMRAEIEVASRENKKLILHAIIVCTLLCLVFAFIFHFYITRAIKSLAKTFNSFINGDFTTEISQTSRRDEIGLLAKAAAEFKTLSLDLLAAKTEAENTSRIKSEFLANMSHEIRTPMNGILGMVQILQGSPLNDRQQEMLSIIDSSGKSLLTILNDILDLSKLEAHKVELDETTFSFSEICNELRSMFSPLAEKKSIALDIPQSPHLLVKVSSDPLRIKQVLINLLSNAIKFTEEGSVSLFIDELNRSKDDITYQIRVKDTGVGIPADSIGSLTEAFTQADTSITRNFGGTGLGLAISSNILDLFDSKLEITSEVHKGTVFFFTLTLPLSALDDSTDIESENPQSLALTLPEKLKILIVDDNEINRIVLASMLETLGQDDIQVTENGLESVEYLQDNACDLVFMDMQMPVMDGISATQAIRNKLGLSHQYIIGLSANVLLEDRQKCFDSGMNDFLTKPLLQDDLVKALQRYFKKRVNV